MIGKATLLALLSAALLAPTVAAAPGAAAAITAARQGVDLTLTSVTPDYATERATEIKVAGTVRNNGAALSGLRVRVRYSSQRFPDRAAMATFAGDTTTATQPPNVSSQSSMIISQLEANASQEFELTMTPAQFGLTSFGAYPLIVEVVQWDAVQLAAQRTFLTYAPANDQRRPVRNRLSFVLPMIDQPRRADDTTFVDDELGAALTGKGRLADLARIAEVSPESVTWVVDPALFDDVEAMTKTFQVKQGNKREERPADPAASQWLGSVRAALADNPVIATPYADPDVAALAHRGLDRQPARALELARQKASLVKSEVSTSTYWPVGGMVDADALDLLAVGAPGVTRVDKVLLDAANLPTQQAASAATALTAAATPDAATTLDTVMGPVTAFVADPELSRILEPAAGTRGATLLSKQRFIAETAMIATEPGQTRPRSLVVAPSRRWNPSPTLVSTLLKTAGKLPWLSLTPLDSIKVPASPVPRAGLTYPDRARKQELGGKYLEPIREVAAQAGLTAQLTGRQQSSFDAAVLRLTSSAWRGDTKAGRAVIEQVSEAVTDRIDKVSITGAGPDRPRTLAGSDGDVPISVRNQLDTPVALYVDVKSDDPDLLETHLEQTEPLRIDSKQSGTVSIPMEVTSSSGGDASVTVQLLTTDRRPYGEPVKLIVRTTGYTGIALVIVGGALTVMLAAVVTRILRRRTGRGARTARTRESEAV